MKALLNYQKKLIAQNRKEYGIYYDQLKKPSYYRLIEAEEERSRLISEIESKAGYHFQWNETLCPRCFPRLQVLW